MDKREMNTPAKREASSELDEWESARPVGLEFGAPTMSADELLVLCRRDPEAWQSYLGLLARQYDRDQLIALVGELGQAIFGLITLAPPSCEPDDGAPTGGVSRE